MRYTYSHWDGSQARPLLDVESLLDALSSDVLLASDLDSALRNIMNQGIQSESLQLPGIHDVLHQLRQQRVEELEYFDLKSALTKIRDQVQALMERERENLRRVCADMEAVSPDVHAALEAIAGKREAALDELSRDTAETMTQLPDPEFVDQDAGAAVCKVEEDLPRHSPHHHVRSMEQSIDPLSGASLRHFKAMLKALDAQVQRWGDGWPEDFPDFTNRSGLRVPDAATVNDHLSRARTDEQGTRALIASSLSEVQSTLGSTFQSGQRDPDLGHPLGRSSHRAGDKAPIPSPQTYLLSEEQSVRMVEALRLLRRISDMDRLERELSHIESATDLSRIDLESIRSLLGDDVASTFEQLQNIVPSLLEAGYVMTGTSGLEITARGMHRAGRQAVKEIFGRLEHSTFGDHPTTVSGAGGDRADTTKLYEHGDAFLLDLHRTVMNGVIRGGAGRPVRLVREDFEVFRTERGSRSATVLMLDLSRSMPLRGCFAAARKVTLALHSLIRTRFPRDVLHVIGFSDLAREIRPDMLRQPSREDGVYGTNMQHGFMLARRLLGRYAQGTRQIILITDGEPTAHCEDGRVHFAYPPTVRTFQETLREVHRCTREGIIINTFMLDQSHYLADFVTQMTRINHGRAFFATPDRLGDFILVDYVRTRQRTAMIGR